MVQIYETFPIERVFVDGKLVRVNIEEGLNPKMQKVEEIWQQEARRQIRSCYLMEEDL